MPRNPSPAQYPSLTRLFVCISREQNAIIVQNSVSLHFQYLQMQTRLRLDIPALADPLVNDLLEESNKFVNSFAKGSPTVLTPLGLVSLVTSFSEVISQIYVLYTLLHHCSPSLLHSHIITIVSVALPRFPRALTFFRGWYESVDDEWPDEELSKRSDWVKVRIAQMEKMAQIAQYRAEVVLFGLADWILECWISAKREDQELDGMVNSRGVFTSSDSGKTFTTIRTALDECVSEMCALLTNVSHSGHCVRLWVTDDLFSGAIGRSIHLGFAWCGQLHSERHRALDFIRAIHPDIPPLVL